jgi:hypothetical protein
MRGRRAVMCRRAGSTAVTESPLQRVRQARQVLVARVLRLSHDPGRVAGKEKGGRGHAPRSDCPADAVFHGQGNGL